MKLPKFTPAEAAVIRQFAGALQDDKIGKKISRSALWVGTVRRHLGLPRYASVNDENAAWPAARIEAVRKGYVDDELTARQVAARIGGCKYYDVQRIIQRYGIKRDPEIGRRNTASRGRGPAPADTPPSVLARALPPSSPADDAALVEKWLETNRPTIVAPAPACGLTSIEGLFYAYRPNQGWPESAKTRAAAAKKKRTFKRPLAKPKECV